MLDRTVAVVAIALTSGAIVFAQAPFPVVGTTYQIDSARFPGKIAICVTETAMSKYMAANATGDEARTKKLVAEVETTQDFAKLKAQGGCTSISSFSQATVVKKGSVAHQAEFAAFPFGPMWGSPLYFGAPVK